MSHLILLHARLQVTISLVLAALIVWGLFCALRRTVSRSYTAVLWMTELLVITEALIGTVMLFSAIQPSRLAMHIVYGVVAITLLPGTILSTQGRSGRREALIYAAVCLFMLGIVGRSYQTGGG